MKAKALSFIAFILLGALCLPAAASEPLYTGPRDSGLERPQHFENIGVVQKIFVKEFRFEGNTVIPTDELHALAAPYEKREVTYQELESLRQALSLHYIQKGYINSGVLLKDQKVADGVITFSVIEGRLTEIEIKNNRYYSSLYLRRKIALNAGSPLNIKELQTNLQLLQQDPRIKKINAELKPGLERGEGILSVNVEEYRPYKLSLVFDNGKSPAIGEYHGEVIASYLNVFGLGDTLEGGYGLTDDSSHEYFVAYQIPLTVYDTMLRVYYSRNENVVVEDPFEDLNIRNKERVLQFSLTQPVYRTAEQELKLGVMLEFKRNEYYLLGKSFDFSDGTEDGKNRLQIWKISQEYVRKSATNVFAAYSSFNSGLNRTIRSDHDLSVDRRFLYWTGQFKFVQVLKLFGLDTQLVLRSDMQLTDDRLLASEQFAFGGMNNVRGYRENTYVRDSGVFGSAELRVPVLNLGNGDFTVRLVPFVDAATGWNTPSENRNWRSISSVGIGLMAAKKDWVDLKVFYGIPLTNRNDERNALQDMGIHFQLILSIL